MENSSQFNPETVCRICMQELSVESLENIYAPINSTQSLSLFDMLSVICSTVFIKREDYKNMDKSTSLPQSACADCRENIMAAYKLHKICIETDHKLRQICLRKQNEIVETIYPKDYPVENYDVTNNVTELYLKIEPDIHLDKHDESYLASYTEFGIPKNIEDVEQLGKRTKTLQRNICKRAFKSKKSLSEKQTCPTCSKIFSNMSSLQRHNRKFHSGKTINLQENDSELYLKVESELHPDNVDESNLASCENLGIQNPETSETEERKESHCNICKKSFKTKKSFKRHCRHFHSDESEVLDNVQNSDKPTCPLCSKVFSNIPSLRRHHRKFHTGKPFTFREMHQETTREYACTQCEKKFRTSVALRYHVKRHSVNHPYLCTMCGKGFRDNSNLRQHFLRHTGNKPFPCEQCPSKFYTKAEKDAHMVTHTGEKRWACDICGSRFTMRYSLKKHKRIHSGHRPHECEFCNLRFAAPDHLKRHMRIHTGERPYKCQFCNRSYSQSNDLVKHSRTHLGTDNLYQCDHCEESFRLLTELRSHYQVHFKTDGKDNGTGVSREWDSTRLEFTSASMLRKRFQKEQQRNEQTRQREIVSSIPVSIDEIPASKGDQCQ